MSGVVLDRVVDGIAADGYAIVPSFLQVSLVAALRADLASRAAAGLLRDAAVGAGASRVVRPEIRGDRISWIDPARSDSEVEFLARLETLRETCNRELQLGLSTVEAHFAEYASGRGYARHLDRSPAGVERVLSAVCYLNDGWSTADGGHLVLETDRGAVEVEPRGGVLVAFLSDRFPHRVEPATQPRRSIAAWFSRRPSMAPVF